ncbi:MAG: hypothetical protein ACM3SP_10925 [Chloroflexota bacterium]
MTNDFPEASRHRQGGQEMTFQDLFSLGMKRYPPGLLTCSGPSFDVGSSGKYQVPGATALGRPDWMHLRDAIPAADDSVAPIHAYHFLEHLTGQDAVSFMREVERVLIPERGVFNFSMPYFNTPLMAHNLDHKSLWCEETFRRLFHDDTYENFVKWRLRVHFLLIAGIVQRNLCIIGQVIKSDKPAAEFPKWYHPATV